MKKNRTFWLTISLTVAMIGAYSTFSLLRADESQEISLTSAPPEIVPYDDDCKCHPQGLYRPFVETGEDGIDENGTIYPCYFACEGPAEPCLDPNGCDE